MNPPKSVGNRKGVLLVKMKNSFPIRITARPMQEVPARKTASERSVLPKHHSLQPPQYPAARIDDLLGDFSEQTGATFG